MKIIDIRDIWKHDVAVSGISVIRQTPAWSSLVQKSRQMNGFLLIDKGNLLYQWKDEAETISHGDLIYLPAGSVHRCDRVDPVVSYYRINFLLTDNSDGTQVVFSDCPVIMAKELGHPMFSLGGEMAESCLSSQSFLTLSLFGEFMNMLIQTMTGTGGSRIRRAVDHISAHYTEETDLTKLAEECYLSRAQFFRLFHQETGVTPLEYRNRLPSKKRRNSSARAAAV